jgi:hypothetical protein
VPETGHLYSPNDSIHIVTCTPIARQRVGKQIPVKTDRQILVKQSTASLRKNSGNRKSVFNVVRAMPNAKQQNFKHV